MLHRLPERTLAVWSATRPDLPRPVRFVVAQDDGLPMFIAGQSPDVAISPSGEHIAYLSGSIGLGAQQLLVRPLDQLTPEVLAEGELNSPFFSADGASVGFYDRRLNAPVLLRVSVRGAPRRPFASSQETCGARAGEPTAPLSSGPRTPPRASGRCRLWAVSPNS